MIFLLSKAAQIVDITIIVLNDLGEIGITGI